MAESRDDFIHLDCPRCGAPLQMEGEILTCPYCRAKLILKRPAGAPAGAPATAPRTPSPGAAPGPQMAAGGFDLQPFSYYDPQSNLEAFSLLVPQGWQMSGGVTWVTSRPAAPVQVGLLLANPQGLEAFELFPNLYFNWPSNPMMRMAMPVGSMYYGFEVRQPAAARDAMHQYVLPRYRQIQGMAIVDEGPSPELAQAVMRDRAPQSQGQYSNDAFRARLHYNQNNQAIGEEISCVAEYTRVMTPGMFGASENIFWDIGTITSFRAGRDNAGQDYAGLYRAILTSFKLNPVWTGLVQQVSQGLISNNIQYSNQILALSRHIAQNQDEIRNMTMQGWQERSAVYDHINEQFSQVTRGVDPYYDPNAGTNVELPTGYNQAWSTPLGEYVLSDDPGFDPNVGSNQTWTPLAPPEK